MHGQRSDRRSRSGQGRLAGRRILVTGASRGIGSAIARICVTEGADVALSARDEARLGVLAAELASSGGLATPAPADVTNEDEVEKMIRSARESLGGLDSAVLCQGLNRISPIAGTETAVWRQVLDTNLTGSFFIARGLARLFAPGPGRRGDTPPDAAHDPSGGPVQDRPGAVVFISSVSGLPGYEKFPGFAAYCAAKRGILGLAEVMEVEMRAGGLRVYTVCPRGVDTEMFRSTFPAAVPELTADEVASRVLDLLDPSTAPASGSVIEL